MANKAKGSAGAKKKRLAKILELISNYDIENQEELQKMLENEGFAVTQATVSRDIKELDLIKVVSSFGSYKYIERNKGGKEKYNKYISIFKDSVIGIDFAGNMVVIKSHIGMANAACAAVDTMSFNGVLGTIAGDDTIFVVCRTAESAQKLCEDISKLIG